ncbi:hypothetical protein BHF68_03435 [Desulfuribacillus alkaliarsenatis]|uniref:NADH dehydrogenase n=3 Tax=Desulfuribacillus alkaliarsenatis TaxID=766136 RepID=A0A1E5G7L0_9FIRM|nr:hypothetical protein BHF68_03435 [Desulfuribacillus alkaliarsenatis]
MNLITIEVNGQTYTMETSKSILDACKEIGIDIPTLCYDKDLKITASCRLCIVEIENKSTLVTACSTPIYDGLKIYTESEKVIEARQEILRLLLANHDLRCLTCHRNGDCRLQDYSYRYNVHDTPYPDGPNKEIPIDDTNSFFVRDYAKCILCGKCVSVCSDINGAHAIDFTNRGYKTKVASSFDESLQNTSCNFCGMCIQVCPVAALVPKSEIGKGRPWETTKVKTTCSYCGVGCQLQLKIMDNQIIGVAKDESGSNLGHLCVKGQFGWEYVHARDRLSMPLIKNRKTGQFEEVAWDVAIDFIYENLQPILNESGGDAVGGLCSAKCTNEENYLFQKLMRTVFTTNNVDHCARL